MTGEEERAAIAAIREFCEKLGIGLVGTCENEGIYGEIRLVDLNDLDGCGWVNVQQHLWNFDR